MSKYTINDFKVGTNLKFIDISSEEWREYRYSNGDVIKIDGPLALNVSKSGGHRIFDVNGISHYVVSGWKHLRWRAREGQPHFVA